MVFCRLWRDDSQTKRTYHLYGCGDDKDVLTWGAAAPQTMVRQRTSPLRAMVHDEPLSVRQLSSYLLSTFAEKYSTWDFYERNSIKTQETICPLNPKYDVIFCVRAKLQGGLCGKATRNNIAYLGKRGQFVPQIDFPRTKKGMFVL